MKRFLLLLLTAVPLLTFSQLIEKDTTIAGDFFNYNNGDTTYIPFYVYLPPDYDPAGSHPVIIYLSGQGETSNRQDTFDLKLLKGNGIPRQIARGETLQFNYLGDQHSFIVLAPQKRKDSYVHPTLGNVERPWPEFYVETMLDYAKNNIPGANMNNVFLTGLSLGAGGAWDYPASSLENARKIMGIAPVSGIPNIYSKSPNRCNITAGGVDVFAFHGRFDGVIPIDSVMYNLGIVADSCPNSTIDVRIDVLDGFPGNSHNQATWDTAYSTTNLYNDTNMYQWMIIRTLIAALPVDLEVFKGKNLSDANILEWITSREENFYQFEIHRSQNGRDYTPIGTVSPISGTTQKKQYTFTDRNAPRGRSHYKLKMIDRDGTYKFSDVVTVDQQNKSYSVEKYPNPVLEDLNVVIEGSMFGSIEVAILDLKGNLIRKQQVRKEQVKWQGKINVDGLAKGVYVLQIKGADGKKDISTFIKR